MFRTARKHHEALRPPYARRLTRATPPSEVAKRASEARHASTVAPLHGVSLMR